MILNGPIGFDMAEITLSIVTMRSVRVPGFHQENSRRYIEPNPYQRTDIPGDPHATGDLRNPETDPLNKREWPKGS